MSPFAHVVGPMIQARAAAQDRALTGPGPPVGCAARLMVWAESADHVKVDLLHEEPATIRRTL
jgi:hypothetical protein